MGYNSCSRALYKIGLRLDLKKKKKKSAVLGFSSFPCLPGMGAVCVEEGSKAVGIANTSISVHPREAGKQTQVCSLWSLFL